MDRLEKGVTAPVLLFDLGGVVVDFRGGDGIRALTGLDLDFCRGHWWRLPELDPLERGAITPEVFAAALIEKSPLNVDEATIIDALKHCVFGVYDGAPALFETHFFPRTGAPKARSENLFGRRGAARRRPFGDHFFRRRAGKRQRDARFWHEGDVHRCIGSARRRLVRA
jgi:hypothetical protein